MANKALRAANGPRYSGRLNFCFYVFTPIAMFFFLPLAFYKMPLRIVTNDKIQEVGAFYVGYAAIICLVWFSVAIGTILWSSNKSNAIVREWTPHALWIAFFAFSIIGSAVSLLHSFFVMPQGIEEIIHQGSLAPILGVMLGFHILRDTVQHSGPRWKMTLIVVLLIVDTGAAILIPLILAKVGPAALGAIGILYGMSATGVSRWSRLVVTLFLVGLVLLVLSFKGYMRVVIYGGPSFQRVPIMNYLIAPRHPPTQLKTSPNSNGSHEHGISSISSEIHRIGARLKNDAGTFDPNETAVRFLPSHGSLRVLGYVAARAVERMNRLVDLAYAVESTPGLIPYAGGVTYYPLIGKLIPRLIWRDSPRESAGQFYGHRYGLIAMSNTVESYNLPVITEGWVNGGWVGVILSAAFVGVLLRFIWLRWIGDSAAPGNVIIGMIIVMQAADGESNLSLAMGGVIHGLLVYWFVEEVIRYWGKRKSFVVRSLSSV